MEKLRQVLTQEDTVLFIGSGISQWSGLPTWEAMIKRLANYVESTGGNPNLIFEEIGKGDLLQAASYGFDKLTKQQIGDFIRTVCCYGSAKPSQIHQKIVSLGPRCYITTNYDNLIEESLRLWQPDRFFRPPVTNRLLTETAEIVHARAIDFIFKPHGDAGDSESIILTREQYRQLLPGGERQAALESLKMLLASRPVIYLGFGFKDPDFIYIRDILANTYKGGNRDHYAIMADITEEEIDYWRRNYGIHLVRYRSTERADKTKDHSNILVLLDKLHETSTIERKISFDPFSSDVILTLTRYTSGLARIPKNSPEFQIRVHSSEKSNKGNVFYYSYNKYDHYPVEKFLDDGPSRVLLIGLPGSGKSYSLRRAAARLAEKLTEACLSGAFDKREEVIPVLADLKFYRGNLWELVSQTLPKNLPLDDLIRFFKLRFFLDSFNEMPREYLESASYESDFLNFLNNIGDSSVVIGSRTGDGLAKLGWPVYCLDEIDEKTVDAELKRLGVEVGGRFEREVKSLFQRPFYFQYVLNRLVSIPIDAHPLDFYRVFFSNIKKEFSIRFGERIDLEKVLSVTAYEALDIGEEAFPLTNFIEVLKSIVGPSGDLTLNVRDVANWLVSFSVFIPYAGGRIAFVHQSITEYLAAAELARRYQSNPRILKEKLSLTRWDQALFLTLSLLPKNHADEFFNDVVKADFVLALNAAKYLEIRRDDVVSRLLDKIPELFRGSREYDFKIEHALRFSLPVSMIHEQKLRIIIQRRGMIGGSALNVLVGLRGAEVKDEFLPMLFIYRDDYNFCCNGIGHAFKEFSSNDDVRSIIQWADEIQKIIEKNPDEDIEGFTSGAARFLSNLDLGIIGGEFVSSFISSNIPKVHAEIVCNILQSHHSTQALEIAGELLLRGVNGAATAIYFIYNFSSDKSKLSWESFSIDHVNRLLRIIDDSDDESWPVDALRCLCSARGDLADLVKQKAIAEKGIKKAVLLQCVSPENTDQIFQALSEVFKLDNVERHKAITVLKRIELDWSGREELFVSLLRLRDKDLASTLIGSGIPTRTLNFSNLEIGEIDWWLGWILEVSQEDDSFWFGHKLGGFFARNLNGNYWAKFIFEFNNPNSKFRKVLMDYVLLYRDDITTDEFNEDAISFLLADLSKRRSLPYFWGNVLARAATEQFIKDRLLPLLGAAKQPLLDNIREILRRSGLRHGKRYIIDES